MAWGKGGRIKPDVKRGMGGRGEKRFVRNTKYCLFFKIKNSRKCDEGSLSVGGEDCRRKRKGKEGGEERSEER